MNEDTDTALKTRQKLKEAYDAEFLATIERAEKQIILARHGRRLLQLLDDSPVVPGEGQRPYHHGAQARQILNDCEDDMKDWEPELDVHQHEVSHGEQLQSPTASSATGGQQTPPRQIAAVSNTGDEAVEITPTAAPQGEHQSARQRRTTADEGDSVSGVAVTAGESRPFANAKSDTQSLQQQLEGSTTLVSESPLSSAAN